MDTPCPRVLATRPSKTLLDTLEVLCLERGSRGAFRLFTTTDESLSEIRWDLDPIEFDPPDHPDVETYLIESFWLTSLDLRELRQACVLYSQGVIENPLGTLNQQSIKALGSLGVVLLGFFNRIQTIDPGRGHSFEFLRDIDATIRRLEQLPNVPASVQSSIHECHLAYKKLIAEAISRTHDLGQYPHSSR